MLGKPVCQLNYICVVYSMDLQNALSVCTTNKATDLTPAGVDLISVWFHICSVPSLESSPGVCFLSTQVRTQQSHSGVTQNQQSESI